MPPSRRFQRSGSPALRIARPDPERAVPDAWDERIAREARHQEVIEASFDRAEAYQRLGDFEQALEWLDRAAVASGGLPPAYRAVRARWARAAAISPRSVVR
jgi:tetratricopeptide (TPR) repeat protein